MKKIRYLLRTATTLIVIAVATSMVVTSCKKSGSIGNPLNDHTKLPLGSYLVKDSTLNLNLNFAALATSTVGITVHGYAGSQTVKSIDLFVSASPGYDPTKWSHVKTIPYTGAKTSVTCTGAELSTALGIPLSGFQPGTNYSFYTRITTTSGQTFDASNAGNDAGSGLVTGSYYNSAFTFTAYIVCPFVGPVGGQYKVVRDDWVDWSPGDVVTVTDAGPNQINLSGVYPGAPDGGVSTGNFIVNIDPATGTAYIPTEDFGSYGGATHYSVTGYGGAVDATLGTGAGYVFSCTGYISVTVDIRAIGSTDYGPNTLILTKVVGP